jgi:hypothetical protein
MTTSPSTAATAGPPPFDLVIGFFQMVFTGSADESAEHKAQISALIQSAFDPDYTFNGAGMKPEALVAWRESLLKQFSQMTFRVNNALSSPVDVGSTEPTTGVTISWTVFATASSGEQLRLDGMNMLSVRAGKAVTNVQLGDAANGWRPAS